MNSDLKKVVEIFERNGLYQEGNFIAQEIVFLIEAARTENKLNNK